jgi:outer membrane lipoprotein carrier protein
MRQLIFIALLLNALQVFSGPSEVLTERLAQLDSMTARFKQIVSEGGHITQKSSGRLYLKKPGKFRWEFTSPTKQLIVSDNKTLWIFDEDLEQVSIKKIGKSTEGSPTILLSGTADELLKNYTVDYNHKKKVEQFKLTPKKLDKNEYQWLTLLYQNKTLSTLTLKDKLGQTTQVLLSNVKIHQKLNASLFNFSPPKGVDIVR